jgi:hypothetical protein
MPSSTLASAWPEADARAEGRVPRLGRRLARSRLALIGGAVVGLAVLAGLAAPVLAPPTRSR